MAPHAKERHKGQVVVQSSSGPFHWLDVINPTRKELERLAERYGIHSTSITDSLQPEHLPKFERIGKVSFAILRAYDERATWEADTVQELTRKTAILVSDEFVITIHRKDQSYLAKLRERWKDSATSLPSQPSEAILIDLLREAFLTFREPIENSLARLEATEMGIFEAPGSRPFNIQQGYYLRRRGSVFRRVLNLSQEVLTQFSRGASAEAAPFFQDIHDNLRHQIFHADDLLESINSLLNLHLSLASHRTNEVMRLLTVLSVFFLPLNFIASIYGMNFEYMPELHWEWGYAYALSLLGSVAALIFFWFKHKGWLR